MQKVWGGTAPSKCDICEAELSTEFFDFKVPSCGRWANSCPVCFRRQGGRLGTGLGQKYIKQDGKFIKVGG